MELGTLMLLLLWAAMSIIVGMGVAVALARQIWLTWPTATLVCFFLPIGVIKLIGKAEYLLWQRERACQAESSRQRQEAVVVSEKELREICLKVSGFGLSLHRPADGFIVELLNVVRGRYQSDIVARNHEQRLRQVWAYMAKYFTSVQTEVAGLEPANAHQKATGLFQSQGFSKSQAKKMAQVIFKKI